MPPISLTQTRVLNTRGICDEQFLLHFTALLLQNVLSTPISRNHFQYVKTQVLHCLKAREFFFSLQKLIIIWLMTLHKAGIEQGASFASLKEKIVYTHKEHGSGIHEKHQRY